MVVKVVVIWCSASVDAGRLEIVPFVAVVVGLMMMGLSRPLVIKAEAALLVLWESRRLQRGDLRSEFDDMAGLGAPPAAARAVGLV